MSGWHYKHSSSEFKFIRRIVEEISNSKLNRTPLYVARYPIGINHRVKIILSDIDSNDAHMIGIYGPAGIDQYDKLLMHDFLQQMGKDIVRRESPQLPGERSRLWCYEDVLDVVTKNTGSKKIRGIMICSPKSSKIQLEPKCLEKMKNLKKSCCNVQASQEDTM
ncbi:hypothetical protein CMV_013874 [Castanea mollissima]|uniref:Disease resistance protein Roq1-like winged-helix domain-containing protein n=1 Tax=Castanea mollissima TaxID=60419 RepID=A0A8J4VUG1_9ROSI|nr:hypothetical protein CMV_013874 [Castanea mollissima]